MSQYPAAGTTDDFKKSNSANTPFGFNPYAKSSGYNSGAMGLATAGAFAGPLAADIDNLTAPGAHVDYTGTGGASKPAFDNRSYNAQYKGMKANYGGNIGGSAATYAAAGSSMGPLGLAGGAVLGSLVGLAKANKAAEDKQDFGAQLSHATHAYNSDLANYNQGQAGKEVSYNQQTQYGSKNPYDIPSQAYWYA